AAVSMNPWQGEFDACTAGWHRALAAPVDPTVFSPGAMRSNSATYTDPQRLPAHQNSAKLPGVNRHPRTRRCSLRAEDGHFCVGSRQGVKRGDTSTEVSIAIFRP